MQNNHPDLAADRADSLASAFARVVARNGGRTAVIAGDWRPTYRELDAAANRVAGALIDAGVAPGDRVVIMMRHDGPQIVAAIAVMKAGAIATVLNAGHPDSSLAETAAHARPRAMIVGDDGHERAAAVAPPGCVVVRIEAALAGPDRPGPAVIIAPRQTAFLIHTSGSTGRPKAVMRTHALLLRNARRHGDGLAIGPDDRMSLLAPLGSGQGVGVLWTALCAGATLCPFPVAERGMAALRDWLGTAGITIYVSSASIFRALLKSLPPDWRCPTIHTVRIASEMATKADFEGFCRHFPRPCRMIHSYGISEIGNVAHQVLTHDDIIIGDRLPVGRPAADLTIALLDESGRPVAPGQTGIVTITGEDLAAGYWNDPEQTARRFSSRPGEIGFTRFVSGDRARLDALGRLELAGRDDAEVKIRGNRVNLVEVEGAIRAALRISEVVACAATDERGDARIIAYVARGQVEGATPARLIRALRAVMPSPMAPAAIAVVEAIPLNAHGKIDRAALLARHPPDPPRGAEIAPRGETERRLTEIWRECLGMTAVGRDDDFFELGGDSLAAAVAAGRIHDGFGVEFDLSVFARHPTLSAQALAIDQARHAPGFVPVPVLTRAPRDAPLPLSFSQERVWENSRARGGVDGYLSGGTYLIRGSLDRAAFVAALDALVRRHEILRTTFSPGPDGPRQVIHPPGPACLRLAEATDPARVIETRREFARQERERITDPAIAPLVRFLLIRESPTDHAFIRVGHHLLGDGVSWRILTRELIAAYLAIVQGGPVPFDDAPRPQYADHAIWQRRHLRRDGAAARAMLSWWMSRLATPWPRFAPRFRRPVPLSGVDPARGWVGHDLPTDLARGLRDLSQRLGVTPHLVGLAATTAVLAEENGDDRIVLGTYMTERRTGALESMLGDFSRFAFMGLRVDRTLAFADWVGRVRDEHAECARNLAIPEEWIRDESARRGLPYPDIGVMFVAGETDPVLRVAGLEIERRVDRGRGLSIMPWGMTLRLNEAVDAIRLIVRFDAGLHDPDAVGAMVERLARVLTLAIADPARSLGAMLKDSRT